MVDNIIGDAYILPGRDVFYSFKFSQGRNTFVDGITKFIVENHWGDWASILGIVITLICFLITILNVWWSRSAAEEAQKAVQRVREDILRINTVDELSKTLSVMDEIKRLHRKEEWEILLDRYPVLRKSLILIKNTYSDLPKEHIDSIQKAIREFSSIERKVELALKEDPSIIKIADFNQTVSKQIDFLQEVLAQIKNKIGR